jgi:hypothetical protein
MDRELFLVALAVSQSTMLLCWYALLASWRAGKRGAAAAAGVAAVAGV